MTYRLVIALTAFFFWTVITVWLGKVIAGGEASLGDIVTRGIGWTWLMAGGFILAVVLWQGWHDVGLNRGMSLQTAMLGWLPMLYIIGGFVVAAVFGLPAPGVLALILLNCMFVGFSEELMFRGALLQAFRHQFPIWPAILLTSVAFGSIHSLNVFVTGDLSPALIQSCAAFLSGLCFIALRLRSGSLWLPIVLHGLWDFSTFSLASATSNLADGALAPEAATTAEVTGLAQFAPILIVLPNAIYGLWLMRNVNKTHTQPEQ